MKIVSINENSSYTLGEEYVNEAKSFLRDNSGLPVTLNGTTLSFDRYIIGSIKFNDLVINIQPRITGLTSNHYLEMQLYNEGILDDKIISLLGENESFGIQDNLIDFYLKETFDLVARGLEGFFLKHREESNSIKGRIIVEDISPVNLLLDKIPIEYEIHTLNTSYNKIIKLALDKVRVIAKKDNHIKIHSIVSSYFNEIDIDSIDLDSLIKSLTDIHYFTNDKYPVVLGLAIKILKDLKINLKSNKIASSSFLVNSNTIFEKYARKVLLQGISSTVTKWDNPQPMGKFKVGEKGYVKSFSPDIMIDYHNDNKTAYAVLDAKNKDISDPKDIGNLADLYQIIFYCHSLEANYGALIYPSFKELAPILFTIDSFKETNLYAFNIDFSKPIKERNKLFIKHVSTILML